MSKQELLRQAENAERHADQTTDETVRETCGRLQRIIGTRRAGGE